MLLQMDQKRKNKGLENGQHPTQHIQQWRTLSRQIWEEITACTTLMQLLSCYHTIIHLVNFRFEQSLLCGI